jgi:hypothetical protein
LVNFPNSQLHDDLVDALAYVDQIQITDTVFDDVEEDYEVLDVVSGY